MCRFLIVCTLTWMVGCSAEPFTADQIPIAGSSGTTCARGLSPDPDGVCVPMTGAGGAGAASPAAANRSTAGGALGSSSPVESLLPVSNAEAAAPGPGAGVDGMAVAGTAGSASSMQTASVGDAGETGAPAVETSPPSEDALDPVGESSATSCAVTAAGTPGRSLERVDVDGVTREYILYVPPSYDGSHSVPLVVDWHPLLTNAGFAESGSGYKELAEREGFIVAFPDSLQSAAWNIGPCCTADRGVDDVGFARALVAQVQENYCVDGRRIYSTGFSMGGGMSHYLACEAADVFAAVAPAAFDLLKENECEPARPITVMSFRSRSDAIVPYGGGSSSPPNGVRVDITFEGAEGTLSRWAEINGCPGAAETDGGCQSYKNCEAGVEVTLCTVGGGHMFADAEQAWRTISRFSMP